MTKPSLSDVAVLIWEICPSTISRADKKKIANEMYKKIYDGSIVPPIIVESAVYNNQPEKEIIQKVEGRSLNDLATEFELNNDQLIMCQNYLVAIRASKKNISPDALMNVINNWDKINKAISLLKFNFQP